MQNRGGNFRACIKEMRILLLKELWKSRTFLTETEGGVEIMKMIENRKMERRREEDEGEEEEKKKDPVKDETIQKQHGKEE